ncbi:MAG: ParA family protein, partial [Candidatus Omnitrophica bacterium]|nr:ParA family protein [Candidatus Omnitrophota bacterium]
IFIDSPPSLGLLTLNSLVASNSVLIPIQCEFYALEGVSQLLHTINLIKEGLNPRLDIEGVLLTMADFRTNLTTEVIKEIRSYFKDKVYETVIPRNIKLSEAPSYGKPIVIYDPTSIGAKKYLEFAREFLGEEAPDLQEASAPENETAVSPSRIADITLTEDSEQMTEDRIQ